MSRVRRLPVLGAAFLGAVASVMASEVGVVELNAPRQPVAGEAVELQVTTGPLAKGARVAVLAEDGKILGAIYPFVSPAGTTGTLPVPAGALSGGRLRLRLQVIEPGAPPRPPRPDEIERLDLSIVPAD